MHLKASASGARKSSGWMALMIISGALVCLWPSAASARSVKEAQAAFDKKQYEEALDLIEQIVKEKGPQPEMRRLKIRSAHSCGQTERRAG